MNDSIIIPLMTLIDVFNNNNNNFRQIVSYALNHINIAVRIGEYDLLFAKYS